MRNLMVVGVLLLLPHAALAQPPRDGGPKPKTGQSVIRGRVVAADTGRPLRRAVIHLSALELGAAPRSCTTNTDGRYEFKDMPAGRYRVVAARSGYLQLQFGQRRPSREGTPLDVSDHQTVDHVDFALPRQSVISGHLTDELGEPIGGVEVLALRTVFVAGRRQLSPIADTATDDEGAYRLPLSPGTYVVEARARDQWTADENGTPVPMGYMPTFFPGTTVASSGSQITLGVGAKNAAVDFALIPGHAVMVSGIALNSNGTPFSSVGLWTQTRGLSFSSSHREGSAPVSPDGTFSFSNVSPGDYELVAERSTVDDVAEVGRLLITVTDTDLTGVSLVGTQGGSVSGQLLADGDPLPQGVLIRFRRESGAAIIRTGGAVIAEARPDATFRGYGIVGPWRFDVAAPEGWALLSAMHDGRDITEAPIELRSGETLDNVQVTLTHHLGDLHAQVLDENSHVAADATLILFCPDRARWFEGSRFVRAVRPDQNGHVTVTGLLPGDYLVAATDEVETGQWFDPEFLESLRDAAHTITISAGQAVSVRAKVTSLAAR